MKKATGELNLTVVVIVAIAAILGFFMLFKDTMFSSAMAPTCCMLNKGSYENGICETSDYNGYSSCISENSLSSSNSNYYEKNGNFISGIDSINSSTIINNVKDIGVENSINSDLSIIKDDNNKDDTDNKNLNKNSKDNLKNIISNTSGGNSSNSGSSGTTGNSSTSGSSGTTGNSSNSGSGGTTGNSSNSGSGGTTGNSSNSGSSGTTGNSSTSGSSGTTGNSSTSGSSGTTGNSSTSGSSGTTGNSSTSGSSGTTGNSSNSGSSGTTGNSSTSGSSGTTGNSSTSGSSGTTGNSSNSGSSGTTGNNGASESSGIRGEYVTSGKVTGKSEKEIKKKASKGFSTVGDYRKSRIINNSSNYSADKKIYTTTSIVKSNTSNYQMRVIYTYEKNSGGEYNLKEISWRETTTFGNLSDGYENNMIFGNKTVKHSYNGTLKEQYNTEKLNKYIEENGDEIYNELNNRVVFLNTYSGDSIVENANGVFINPGVIVTTWNFLKRSVINGDKLIITNNEGANYDLDGIISINTELDLAFIKLKEKIGDKSELGNVYDLKIDSIDFTICTGNDYKLEVKYGYLLKRGGLITSLITLERNEEGSPLFDYNKKLIGINTATILRSSTSIARSTNYIKNLQAKLEKHDFSSIKVTSFKDLKNKYINENSETEDNTIPKDIWNKYKKIGDIENTITLNLIKSSYDDNIVSLRYVNDITEYSDNFALADDFIAKLIKQGYKKKHSSTYKIIYQKGNSKVILLSEFNYLIIVMTGA